MNTFLTSAVLLSVLSPAAAFAQAAPPATPVPPATAPAPRTETLRLKFKSGEMLYYRLVEETAGSYREPRGKLTPIQSHLEIGMHQTTTDRREADGAGLIRFGIDSMTVTVDKKPPNDPAPDPAVLANLAALVVLPSGKLEDTAINPAFDAKESLPGEDPAHMNALAGFGELPPAPVSVGSRWKSPVFLGLIGEKTAADLSLTAWETKDVATLAVITQALKGSFSTPPPEIKPDSDPQRRGDMKITGWTAGTRTVRLNVEAGRVESQESVVWMTVLLTPRDENGKFTGLPTRMWIKVTSTLVRTAAPTKAASGAPT